MTQLLVRVLDAREAAQAEAAGIDGVEFVIADGSAPGLATAASVRSAFSGFLRLRFTGARRASEATQAAASIGAEQVALAFDAFAYPAADGATTSRPKLVAVLPTSVGFGAIHRLSGRVDSIMLDAGTTARLVDRRGITDLDAFATTCRANGMAFGLAGGLEAPDVSRLLLLRPDVLAFDTAVRTNHAPDGALDTQALDAIRALVPRANNDRSSEPVAVAKVIDRIFVRDFEVLLAIGAYQAEHGTQQRVRFGIVADVERAPGSPRDMRDVFSYDVIIETIRVLAKRAHVLFVETLAEEVAASLLAHAEVVAVNVKVEKMDVIPGIVGIEIVRRRGDRA